MIRPNSPYGPTYYLGVTERHIHSDDAIAAGIRDRVYAMLSGDLALIRFAFQQITDRLQPGRDYAGELLLQSTPFGTNRIVLFHETCTAGELVDGLALVIERELRERPAEWPDRCPACGVEASSPPQGSPHGPPEVACTDSFHELAIAMWWDDHVDMGMVRRQAERFRAEHCAACGQPRGGCQNPFHQPTAVDHGPETDRNTDPYAIGSRNPMPPC